MAHAAGVELNGPNAGLRNGFGVYAGVNVRLHDPHAVFPCKGVDGSQQRGGLAAARRGHQIQKEGLFFLQLGAELIRLPVVVFKNALLDLVNLKAAHYFCHPSASKIQLSELFL